VVGEDAPELGCRLIPTQHLAPVESDHQAVLRERTGHLFGVACVPAADEPSVETGECGFGVHRPESRRAS
jgi:hypothetical protein